MEKRGYDYTEEDFEKDVALRMERDGLDRNAATQAVGRDLARGRLESQRLPEKE